MSRFEDDLGRALADLADELAGGHPPSAEDAVVRHRRARRKRAGVATTVLAIAAVAVGVPVGVAAVRGSAEGGPASQVSPSTSAEPSSSSSSSPSPSSASSSPGAATPTDAAWQARLQEGADLAAQLAGPIAPAVPSPFDTCPDIAGEVSAQLGVTIAPDGDEGGSFDPSSNMCLWATPDTVAEIGDPSARYGMTVRFLPDLTVADVRDDFFVCDQGGPCPTVDAPTAGPDAILVSDLDTDLQSLDLVVPEASGAGIWVIDVYRGTGYTGPSLLQGLNAISTALDDVYRTP